MCDLPVISDVTSKKHYAYAFCFGFYLEEKEAKKKLKREGES
jgi:hypothetical protein